MQHGAQELGGFDRVSTVNCRIRDTIGMAVARICISMSPIRWSAIAKNGLPLSSGTTTTSQLPYTLDQQL